MALDASHGAFQSMKLLAQTVMRTGATRGKRSLKHCDKCLHRFAGSERAIMTQKIGAIRSRVWKGITISRWCRTSDISRVICIRETRKKGAQILTHTARHRKPRRGFWRVQSPITGLSFFYIGSIVISDPMVALFQSPITGLSFFYFQCEKIQSKNVTKFQSPITGLSFFY
jgi:hypothetical protein